MGVSHVWPNADIRHMIKTQIIVTGVRLGGQRSMGPEDRRHQSKAPQYKHCGIE